MSFENYKLAKKKTKKVVKEANWKDEVDFNVMWNKMTDCITHVAKEELGESKGMIPPGKDTSW